MQRPQMPKSVYSEAYTTMVGVLVQCRQQNGVTQVELAERLKKPQSFISKIEQRQRRVDVIEFCAIARALGVDPSILFGDLMRALPGEIVI